MNLEVLTPVIISGAVYALLLAGWLLTTYVVKLRLSTRMLGMLLYLLIVGVGTYQIAPIASTSALAGGFGLALVLVLTSLAVKR